MATAIIIKDGLEYTASNGRLRYNPELHDQHGELWVKDDLLYLCGLWERGRGQEIALALGRTVSTCMTKVYQLRKGGVFTRYRNQYKR